MSVDESIELHRRAHKKFPFVEKNLQVGRIVKAREALDKSIAAQVHARHGGYIFFNGKSARANEHQRQHYKKFLLERVNKIVKIHGSASADKNFFCQIERAIGEAPRNNFFLDPRGVIEHALISIDRNIIERARQLSQTLNRQTDPVADDEIRYRRAFPRDHRQCRATIYADC